MDIQKTLKIAISNHNKGHLKEAGKLYRDILKVAKKHPIALTLLAKISLSNGRYEEVKKALSIILKNYPGYMKAQILAGEYYSQIDQPYIASDSYKRAILLSPNQAEPMIALGNLNQRGAEPDETVLDMVLRRYRQASIVEPTSIPALNNLAAIYLKLKHPAKALETLDLVFRLDPKNIRSLGYKTIALMGIDEVSEVECLVGFGNLVRSTFLDINKEKMCMGNFNSKLIKVLKNHPNRTSEWDISMRAIRGGEIVPRLFGHKDPILEILKISLEKVINKYISELPVNPNHPFLMSKPDNYSIDIWANFLGPKNYQSSHIHNQGWLSGVYYVSTNEISKIEEEPNAGWIEFNRPGYGLPLLGGEKFLRKIKPEPGLVILFPSYVWHGTIPFSTGGERISIAFDVHI